MAMKVKRCKYERCNQKFGTYRDDQECCSPACNAAVKAEERNKKTLNGKKVLFAARGAVETI